MANEEPDSKPTPTLWTAPAPTGEPPLHQARLDPTVTKERIEAALDQADKRSAAFSHQVTPEMLAKIYY